MNSNENNKNYSVLYVFAAVIAVLSFAAGFIAGTAVTRAVMSRKYKHCCGKFDVNEYVRSLNCDE